jgi:hypothetical protein
VKTSPPWFERWLIRVEHRWRRVGITVTRRVIHFSAPSDTLQQASKGITMPLQSRSRSTLSISQPVRTPACIWYILPLSFTATSLTHSSVPSQLERTTKRSTSSQKSACAPSSPSPIRNKVAFTYSKSPPCPFLLSQWAARTRLRPRKWRSGMISGTLGT